MCVMNLHNLSVWLDIALCLLNQQYFLFFNVLLILVLVQIYVFLCFENHEFQLLINLHLTLFLSDFYLTFSLF